MSDTNQRIRDMIAQASNPVRLTPAGRAQVALMARALHRPDGQLRKGDGPRFLALQARAQPVPPPAPNYAPAPAPAPAEDGGDWMATLHQIGGGAGGAGVRVPRAGVPDPADAIVGVPLREGSQFTGAVTKADVRQANRVRRRLNAQGETGDVTFAEVPGVGWALVLPDGRQILTKSTQNRAQ